MNLVGFSDLGPWKTQTSGGKGDLTVTSRGEMESGRGGKSPTGAVAKTGLRNQDQTDDGKTMIEDKTAGKRQLRFECGTGPLEIVGLTLE